MTENEKYIKQSLNLEQAKEHFNTTQTDLLIMSIVSACFGLFAFLLGFHEILTEPSTPLASSLSMTLLGAGHTLAGCSGILFSRKQNRIIRQNATVIYEPYSVLKWGWIIWSVSFVLSVNAFSYCISNHVSGSMIMTGCALLLLCLSLFFFISYRFRSILLYGEYVEYTNCLGRKKTFRRTEIRSVNWSLSGNFCCVFDIEGRWLFLFHKKMVHVDELIRQFPGIFQNWPMRL